MRRKKTPPPDLRSDLYTIKERIQHELHFLKRYEDIAGVPEVSHLLREAYERLELILMGGLVKLDKEAMEFNEWMRKRDLLEKFYGPKVARHIVRQLLKRLDPGILALDEIVEGARKFCDGTGMRSGNHFSEEAEFRRWVRRGYRYSVWKGEK